MTMMGTLAILRVLLFIAEALAVSTLLPLLVFALTMLLRRRAALRHLLWLAVFAMLLALPLLAVLVPSHVVLAQAPLQNYIADYPPVPVTVAMAAPVTAAYARSWDLDSILALVFAPLCVLWFLGVCWNLLRLGLGAYGLGRLRAQSQAFDRLPHDIKGCDVRLAGGGPLTYGWRKPVILLPHAARGWTQARLDAVLRHELAHVRRGDSLTQTLAQLACALYWPNPLVWLAARHLRREAEIAADDHVLASGLRPSAYAAELLQLASEFRARPRFAALSRSSVAMAAPSALESRVTSVLSSTPSRQGVTAMDALKIACLGACATALLAAARPSFAEPRPAAPQALPLAAPTPMAEDAAAPPAPPAPIAAAAPPAAPAHRHVRMVVDGDVPSQFDAMVDRAQQKAHAALDRARAAGDQALSPERLERIMAQAQRHIADAQLRVDAAMQRVAQVQERADTRVRAESSSEAGNMTSNNQSSSQSNSQSSSSSSVGADGVRETVRQTMVQTGADMAQIEASVRLETGKAASEARISSRVSLAQAQTAIASAIAQARAQAHQSLKAKETGQQ